MHASSSSSSIKSFQNCSESDVKGYNDCPEFLFNLPTRSRSSTNLNKKRSISINFDTLNSDTFGNIRPAMTPPPPRTFKRVSSTGSSILSQVPAPYPTPISDTPNPLLNTSTPADLSDDQLIEKINYYLNYNNINHKKLSLKEFEFYKKKIINSNLLNKESSSLNSSIISILSNIFNNSSNKSDNVILLRNWLANDITISNWCPSFLKLYENARE